MVNEISGGGIIIRLDSALISKEAIAKCLYWYSDRFRISQHLQDDGVVVIKLRPVEGRECNLDEALLRLERDFVDWNLREIVARETTHIKQLLIAKAFSNGEFDNDPQSQVSDPVGFKPPS